MFHRPASVWSQCKQPDSPFYKALAKVMVLRVMASDGKKSLVIFILDSEKVTANSYQPLLCHLVACGSLPRIQRGTTCFSRTAHLCTLPIWPRGSLRITRRRSGHSSFATVFLLDFNPLDHGIRWVLQTKITAPTHKSTKSLRWTIQREWNQLSKAMVRHTCCMFRLCIERVDAADGS